jgi:leader peptidase (prepilin peptidase)/N-methyltransferase
VEEIFMLWPLALLAVSGILGLIVGSFLNVVAYRLPIMMDIAWAAEHATAGESLPATPPRTEDKHFSLWWPPSACPHCDRRIKPYENIPVVSYLFLRGRCAGCGNPIAKRYPIVEACVGALSVVVAWRYGATVECAAALLLTWTLVALSLIDIDRYLLPDVLTLPLLWTGLLLSLVPFERGPVFADLQSSVIGAAAGYLSLWSVFQLFKLATGKEGMGYGDFKLLAALGAWLGWQMLPVIILLSAVVGTVFGLASIALYKRSAEHPIPFGPYLAAAGWVALLWGDDLLTYYMNVML